jgi:predicted PurR-regulated permease PerM
MDKNWDRRYTFYIMEKEKIRSGMSGRLIQNVLFGVILVLLFLLACKMFAPFFTVLLWAVLIYIIINPLYKKIEKKINVKTRMGMFLRTMLAGAFAFFSVLIVFIPLGLVVWQLYVQGIVLVKGARDYISQHKTIVADVCAAVENIVNGFLAGVPDEGGAAPMRVITADDIQGRLMLFLNGSIRSIFAFSGALLRNVGIFLLGLVLMIFSLFFFYLDARHLSSLMRSVVPIKTEYIAVLVRKFKDIGHDLIIGYLTVAFVQSLLAFIVFSAFSVPGAFVFACLTFVCVFIPMLGGALVWMPIGIARILSGDIFGGILLLIVAGVCISLFDNILRPFLLRDKLHLHPLVIFFSILGGLSTFGFNGLILGPLVVALFLTVLEMFRKEHHLKREIIVTSNTELEGDKYGERAD